MSNSPNVLWLTTDHHIFANHYDFQPQFAGSLKTMERLASGGMRFQQAYTSCPLCTPARASMLTGCYPHRHGMELNPTEDKGFGHNRRRSFEHPEELFAYAMKQHGYRVAHFGKWHVGDKLADELGFEGWSLPGYGEPLRSTEYLEYLHHNNLPKPKARILWDARHLGNAGKEYALTENTMPNSSTCELLSPKETHEAYFIADMACRWLEEYSTTGNKQSFVLKADVWGPHQPYYTVSPFKGQINPLKLKQIPTFDEKYKNKPYNYTWTKEFWKCISYMKWEQMSQVLAVCYEHAMLVDDALGRIVDKLEQLGLHKNTMVILTADHGDILGAHGGLFNKETLLVEETMKVPLIIQWPGRIAPGEVRDDLVLNMDIPTTILATGEIKPTNEMDGINLLGETKREHLMCQTFGCRQREFVQRLLRWKNYKYIAHHNDTDELYDLISDPFEMENLICNKHHESILHEMQNRLLYEMQRLNDIEQESQEIIMKLKKQLIS